MSRSRFLRAFVAVAFTAVNAANASAQSARVEFAGDSAVMPIVPGLRPMVDVMINGRGPFRMLVETGSAASHFLPSGAAKMTRDPGNARRTDTISFGTARLIVPMIDEIGPVALSGVDGLIGLDAFAEGTMTFDFPARRVSLVRDTLPAANGRDVLRAHRSVAFWAVDLDLPSGKRSAILDTQNGLSLTVTPAVGATFAFTTAPATVGRARGPSIGDVALQRARLAGAARLGDAVLEQPIVDLMPKPSMLPQDGVILGLNVLSNFAISLDQRTQRIRFARADRRVPAPPPLRSSGLTMSVLADGNRRVSAIVDSLPAHLSGLVVGDLVFEINGRPTKELNDDAVRELLAGTAEVRIAVRRGEEEVEMRFVPKALGF